MVGLIVLLVIILLFYLECLRRAGHITYEEMRSHMWKSLDEIKEIVELKRSDKVVWNWEK